MWYFSWILGLGLACAFGILNAMWLELDEEDEKDAERVRYSVRKKSALSALFGAPEPARDDAPREE
jgi:cyd operon protein YbgT